MDILPSIYAEILQMKEISPTLTVARMQPIDQEDEVTLCKGHKLHIVRLLVYDQTTAAPEFLCSKFPSISLALPTFVTTNHQA